MKFIVTRTSSCSEKQPCEEAKRVKLTVTETLSTDNLNDVPYYKMYPHKWGETGTNHRIVDGKCARDVEKMYWVTNFSSLKAVQGFIQKYGDCVMGMDNQAGLMTIEIYDDYRE